MACRKTRYKCVLVQNECYSKNQMVPRRGDFPYPDSFILKKSSRDRARYFVSLRRDGEREARCYSPF